MLTDVLLLMSKNVWAKAAEKAPLLVPHHQSVLTILQMGACTEHDRDKITLGYSGCPSCPSQLLHALQLEVSAANGLAQPSPGAPSAAVLASPGL